jgi:NAD(P)-dependent dehydrogenase (short-subunit alcohol dehydrogenase family)
MKTIVITGANSGIGLATAHALVKEHRLILVCRNLGKGQDALGELRNAYPQAQVELVVANLGDLNSVAKAADDIAARHPVIDVLLNNAGYVTTAVKYNNDGIEETFYASHLGHMLLTQRLLPALEKSPEARIINVSSAAHQMGKYARMMQKVEGLSIIQSYADAKLANVLFSLGLSTRTAPSITSYSLHPGVIRTGFGADAKGLWKFMIAIMRPFFSSPDKGARTSVYLATAPITSLKPYNGGYFADSKPKTGTSKEISAANAKGLWEQSEAFLKRKGFL